MLRDSDGVAFDKSRCINQEPTFEYASKYFAESGVEFEDNIIRLKIIGKSPCNVFCDVI